ncbi:hypothetical protein M9H77_05799 [Catharanthus roseus]|uniref:Uncharacterized protein n=1 Tax=Catharanthus roseus TaxID=4058 RepID=A0ACC0BQE9_CATRO|nr:hypothetical protein M9H77_05799 [Catharanthus roseus]
MMRRHGWQRPLHPLQMVGMTLFGFLVVSFYCFLGIFLGNKIAEITVTAVFSFSALSAALLFIRCTAIDPTDKTRFRFRKKKKQQKSINSYSFSKLNYGLIIGQLLARFFRRIERKFLRTCIRRKYVMLDSSKTITPPMEPLLPLPLLVKDDSSVAPDLKLEDISFCSLCDFEVQKHSKHCRTCNRCVEGFDHHCRWLNNCVGKKNYTTFVLLMIFVLIMLLVEGGTAIAIFIRCFVDRRGIEHELLRRHYAKFPRGLLAAISVLLALMTAYSSAALGQLFFFHVLLIRKGMRTYDYILALRDENQFMELDSLEDSDYSSDESINSTSPEKPRFISRFIRRAGMNQNSQRLSIRIDGETESLSKKQGFQVSINPWKLITMSSEKALLAASNAKERLLKQKDMMVVQHDSLKPLPLETKSGPLMKPPDSSADAVGIALTQVPAKEERLPAAGSPGKFSSPRRRFSCSPTLPHPASMASSPKHRYRSNFDLKLTQVSRELETYISRQVLCSIMRKDVREESPK